MIYFSGVVKCIVCHERVYLGILYNGLIYLTHHVMSGRGILFFIMSNCTVVVALQSTVTHCRVSLSCLHSLHVGSISGWTLQ